MPRTSPSLDGRSRPRRRIARLVAFLLVAPSAAIFSQTVAHAAACAAGTVTVTRTSSPVLYTDASSPPVSSAYESYRITNTTGTAYPDLWVTTEGFAVAAKIKPALYEPGRTHIGALAAGASKMAFFYLTSSVTASGSMPTAAETHTIGVYGTRPDLAAGALCTASSTMTADHAQNAAANKVTGVVSGPTPPQLGGIVTITVSGDSGTIGGAGTYVTTPAVFSDWRADAYQMTGSSIVMTGGNNRTDVDTLYL
ncbi:MAG: trimeric autotransporter adhesin, partial [Frankiaceae bacterium]|nr:trimeric autotransporter adhesin [Frankiaceae bacterium]